MTRRPTAALVAFALALVSLPATAAKPAAANAAEEASYVAKQAIDYYKNGDPRMAADLYRRAYRIDPAKPEYLFGAARAEQKAGRTAEALVAYQTVLALMPSTDPLAKKAQTAIDELKALPAEPAKPVEVAKPVEPVKPAEVAKPAEPVKPVEAAKPVEPAKPVEAAKPVVTLNAPQAPEGGWKSATGWALVGTGGAAVVVGAILGGMAASGRSALDGNKDAAGYYDPSKITHDEIVSKQTAINSQVTGAVICGAVGVVAAGVGTWALLTAPSKVAFVPGPGAVGAGLAWSF